MQATVLDKRPRTTTLRASIPVRVEPISPARIFFSSFPNKATTTSDIIACDTKHIFDDVSGIHFVDWPFDTDLHVDPSRTSCRPTSQGLPSHGETPVSLVIESC